ncbi:hypothetical protein [Methylobacterium brachiatum]|uniref:hypothetical protein n=1 Tax=Methylobacterium brachiatum TaxID=269660 RepID=UPI0003FCB124|nr:hypothetical protein [Methylobacterium brachiatum]SFI80182.1 hypothetical protein SAMN02799642_02818 [Methylobacterium brachiatum]
MLRDGDATFQTTDFLERIGKVKARQAAADDALRSQFDIYEREAAEHTLELVYRHLYMLRQSVQVMHDMPDEEIIPILRAKVRDHGGATKFCAAVRRFAGLELDPDWIEELIEGDEADHPAASVSPLLKSALVGLSAGMNVNSANISRRAAGGIDAEMGGER